MKLASSCLILLAIFFTLTISAPLERRHGLSPRHRLSRRIQATLVKRPLNFAFTPIGSGDSLVRVEYDVATERQASDLQFSSTLLKLDRDGNIADAERPPVGWDTPVAARPVDPYEGHRIVISAPDSVVQALQQKGILMDDMPHYVRQNLHVADANTGGQYQLVPDNGPASINPGTITIALSMN